MKASTRNRVRARLGAALIAGSMATAVLAVPGGSFAQEAPSDAKAVEVEKDAVYARPAGNAAPNTVTSEFPPGVVCLVIVQFCNEQAQQVTGPINQGLQNSNPENTPDNRSQQQVRAPNTITVAQNSGEERYAGGIKFTLPTIPADQEVVSAQLVLTEVNPTYHTSSPFFRQMMLAALAGVRDQQGAFQEAQKAIMGVNGAYPPANREVGNVGVEVCPFTADFTAGTNEWANTPDFDCIFGANGVRLQANGGWIWVFDMTFTLQAWADGTLPNNGLYVRATKAPNLAFGDPDTSWQAQISFGSKGSSTPPALAVQTVAASSGTSSFVPPPAAPADTSSGSGGEGAFFPPPQAFPSTSSPTTSAPVSEPGAVAAPAAQPAAQPALQAAPASAPTTPWWVWLLVPTFLLGMFMVSQSLTAEVQAVATREGAMTRLIRQRNSGELATASPQFQV